MFGFGSSFYQPQQTNNLWSPGAPALPSTGYPLQPQGQTWGQLPSQGLAMPQGYGQGSPWQMQPMPQGPLPGWGNSPAGMGPQINPQQAYLAAGTQPLARQQPVDANQSPTNQWAAVAGLGNTVDNVWTGPLGQMPRYNPTGSIAQTLAQHRFNMLDAWGGIEG